MADLARFVIHRGRDPFTPPQTKVDWVSSSLPRIKVPVLRYKFMNSEIELIVVGPDGNQFKEAAEDCLKQAAFKSLIAAIVAAYASGGTAATTAAVTTFASTIDSCMENKLQTELNISAELRSSSHWDADWS